MKNLIKILGISLAIGLLGIGKTQDLQERKIKKFYFGEEVIKDIVTIDPEKIKFYYVKSSFDILSKKVKIADPHNYAEYVSMIDPKGVAELASKIEPNKNILETAKLAYDLLKREQIKYIPDPCMFKSPLEFLALEDELNKVGKSPMEASVKDYVKHPDQTLKDKGGDCEDLSILYSSLLIAKGFQAGLIVFQNHVMSIFKIDKKEIEKNNLKNYLKDNDGNFWIPIEISSIEDKDFPEALEKGFINFLCEFPCYRIVFNSSYFDK
ncbi:MAG: hypothetical protein QXK80_00100 [Candidatus Pacearchaeota archaeon]